MSNIIQCWNCKSHVHRGQQDCPTCNAKLFQDGTNKPSSAEERQDKEDKERTYKTGLYNHANQARVMQAKITLARIRPQQKLADGSMIFTDRMVVEHESDQVITFSVETKAAEISPGKYLLSKIVAKGGTGVPRLVGNLTAEVSQKPLNVVFFFPDVQDFKLGDDESEPTLRSIDEAMRSLNLRTSDGLLGGAQIQLRLKVRDPLSLIQCVEAQSQKTVDPTTGPKKEKEKSWIKYLWDRITTNDSPKGKRYAETQLLSNKSITLRDIYDVLKHELSEALVNSVRNFTIENIYSKDENTRSRLRGDIQRYMSESFRTYGIDLESVVHFNFRSPEYEKFLQRNAEVLLETEDLKNQKLNVENKKEKRELQHEDYENAASFEHKKNLFDIQNERERSEQADLLSRERRQRAIAARDEALEASRRQRGLDETMEDDRAHKNALRAIELQTQLQKAMLEVHNQAEDGRHRRQLESENARHNRQIEAVKLISSLPAEQQFIAAMQYNPELQHSFIAMQQANAGQEKLDMAQRFQTQVGEIYGAHSSQTNALILEAAKQLGLIASKRAAADTTKTVRILTNEADAKPDDPTTGKPST